MKVFIEGVWIELTEAQVAVIEKGRKGRQRCVNSFTKMLRHFGFKRMTEVTNAVSYGHPIHHWYAEVDENEVWMVGKGLKDNGGMPGGYHYATPKEIETELLRFNQTTNGN